MAKRLKGLDTVVMLTENGQLNGNFTDIENHEFTIGLERKKEYFVGESGPRLDEVYDGVEGNFTLQCSNHDFLRFAKAVSLRAMNREVNVQFSLTTTFNLPGVGRKRVTFPDIYFGPMPVTTGGQKEYVKVKIDWGCGPFRIG